MSEINTEQNADGENANQPKFKRSPYKDATWEFIGERLNQTDFEPLAMEVVDGGKRSIDQMFADYGGSPSEGATQRWHLPEHLTILSPAQKEAKRQAESIAARKLSLFPEELEQIKLAEFKRGQEAGVAEAVEQNNQRIQDLETRFKTLFEDLKLQFQERLLSLESSALKICLDLARQIIATHVEIHPDYIAEVIKEALSKSASATISRVRVSPEDFEFIEVLGLEKSLRQDDQSWLLVKDATVKSGCIIETSAGEIDYQLDKAWQRIAEQVFGNK